MKVLNTPPTIIALAVVFLTSVLLSFAQAEASNAWEFQSDEDVSYHVQASVDAQDGQFLMVIDGTTLEFPLEYTRKDQYWYQPFRPSGYVYQSINAKPYTSKHLHISGFARGIKPNFTELEKQFSDYYTGAEKVRLQKTFDAIKEIGKPAVTKRFEEDNATRLQEKLQEFKEFIRRSYKNSEYGIAVVLDMGDDRWGDRDIRNYGPTSLGAPRLNELWNRFNIEVSVPPGCRSISIVLWQQGIAISEFDHLAVTDRGSALASNASYSNIESETLITKIIENDDLATRFSNLSFE